MTEFASSIFPPKGPQPTTCHLRAHFEFFQWLAAPFPSHSQLPTRLLQTRRFRPGLATGRDVSLLASTEPKRSAHFARRNEAFRGSYRKSLKSLPVTNQRFRGIVCFQGLESVSFHRFRRVILFKDLVPFRFRLAVGPSWSFGRVMWRAGWAVTSHSPVLTPKSQLARRHDKCEPGLSTFLKNIISSTSRLGKKLSIFLREHPGPRRALSPPFG